MDKQSRVGYAKSYGYPNHLTHGLLAKHCTFNTANDTVGLTIKPGAPVLISENDSLLLCFKDTHRENININVYLKNWLVLDIISDANTGYLGIIYINQSDKQLVLVHKCEPRCVTYNICGLKVEVLMGNIFLHQAHGYLATRKAVDVMQKNHRDFTLSFAGHSIGAWLANLSVFYCHYSFHYQFVQAVTFDGPGALEMMKTLSADNIKGCASSHECKLENLDIVCYFSDPNIVNCTNNHVGRVYRLYPSNLKSLIREKDDGSVFSNFIEQNSNKLANISRDLNCILSQFDASSGKPKECKLIEIWPTISYVDYQKRSSKFSISSNVQKAVINVSSEFNEEIFKKLIPSFKTANLDGIIHLAVIISEGKLDLPQNSLVPQHFNKCHKFKIQKKYSTKSFTLQCHAQYKESDGDTWRSKRIESKNDFYLKELLFNKPNVQGRTLRDIIDKCTLNEYDYFEIKERHRDMITVDDIRDEIIHLRHRNTNFEQYLINISEERLKTNLKDGPCITSTETKVIEEASSKHQTIIVKGMSGTGKTALVQAYAQIFEDDFTSWFLSASSKNVLKESFTECLRAYLKISNDSDPFQSVKSHLERTKQPVLFILDDVKAFTVVSNFIEIFSSLNNVRFVITTQHDKLDVGNDIPQITLGHVPDCNTNFDLRKKLKSTIEELVVESQSVNEAIKRAIRSVLNILSFLKSDTESRQELVTNLLVLDNTPEDSELAVEKLQSLSLLTIGFNQVVSTNELIQTIALETCLFKSAAEFLHFISLFKPKNLLLKPVLSKLLSFAEEIQQIGDLKMNLTAIQKSNVESILPMLQTEVQSVVELQNRNEAITTLKNVADDFEGSTHDALQSLTMELLNVDIEQKHQRLLETSKSQINLFLELFGTFTEDVNKDFLLNDDEFIKISSSVLIIGPTGAGKSTVTNYLIGNNLEFENVGLNGNINVVREEGSVVAPIGDDSTISKTDYITPYYNKKKKIIYWDFPGFFDNRGMIKIIKHAFAMRAFSKAVSHFKILFVVEHSSISKGELIRMLNQLNELCSGEIKDGLSLLITKCDRPENKETQRELYVAEFGKFYKKNKSKYSSCKQILKILKNKTMVKRIALFPKVTKSGLIEKDFLQDLDQVIEASNCGKISFNLQIDDQTNATLLKLNSLLNCYVKQITQECAEDKAEEVKEKIRLDSFRKEHLSPTFKFSISNKIETEIEFSEAIRKASFDKTTSTVISNIAKTLRFFSSLNSSLSAEPSKWIKPLALFNEIYSEITQNVADCSKDWQVVVIQVPILSASEIRKLCNRKTKIAEIKAASYLFIVDEDLTLPGINLSISSVEWRIIGNKNISLKGTLSEEKVTMHSGSFEGYAAKVNGGKISFDLDGTDGEPGTFDLSHANKETDRIKKETDKSKAQLESIEKLKNLYVKELEKMQQKVKQEASQYGEKILDSEKQNKEKNVEKVIEKLEHLKGIYSKYKLVEEEYNKKRKDSIHDKLTASQINPFKDICKEIEKIDKSLLHDPLLQNQHGMKVGIEELQWYDKKRDLLTETKTFFPLLKVVECQFDKKYCELQEQRQILEAKHVFQMDNNDIELSAKDFNDLLSNNKSSITNKLQKNIETLTEEIKKTEQQIFKLKEDMEIFYKQHENVKKSKKCKDAALSKLDEERKSIEKSCPKEFQKIQKIFNKITKTSTEKNEISEALRFLLEEKDKTVINVIVKENENVNHDPSIPVQRYLLRSKNAKQFIESYNKEIKKLNEESKNQQPLNDTYKKLIEDYVELQATIEIYNVKKKVNKLIDQYHLHDSCKKYNLNDESQNEKVKKFSEVCKQLKELLKKGHWYKRLFYITDKRLKDFVDDIAGRMQESLKKRAQLDCLLKNAEGYEKRLREAVKNYEDAEKRNKEAGNEYDLWKKKEYKPREVPAIDNYVLAYENFLNCKIDYKKSRKAHEATAQKLLLNKVNWNSPHFERNELKFNERDASSKVEHVFKEIFLFTRQFYEKYKLCGTEGTAGSNSGTFSFNCLTNCNAHIVEPKPIPGKGGQHSLVLEGKYLNEYCFPLVRGIKKTNGEYESNLRFNSPVAQLAASVALAFTDDIVSFAVKGLAVSGSAAAVIASFVVSLSVIALQCVASALSAKYCSKWVDGPYKIQTAAKGGKLVTNDKSKLSEDEYTLNLSPDLKSFFQPFKSSNEEKGNAL